MEDLLFPNLTEEERVFFKKKAKRIEATFNKEGKLAVLFFEI